MDREAFDQTIRMLKHRKPLHPFTVVMQNGDRLEVDHPDGLAIRDGVALFAGPGGVPSIFDYKCINRVIGERSDGPAESA